MIEPRFAIDVVGVTARRGNAAVGGLPALPDPNKGIDRTLCATRQTALPMAAATQIASDEIFPVSPARGSIRAALPLLLLQLKGVDPPRRRPIIEPGLRVS